MSKIKVEVEVSKEAHELAQALADVAIKALSAVEDGFQAGQDLPVILVEAVSKLPSALDGVNQIGAELKEDADAFAMAFMVAGQKVSDALQAKKGKV